MINVGTGFLKARRSALYLAMTLFVLAATSPTTFAQQSLINSIPPEVIATLRSMPPHEAQLLAEQYGIRLPEAAGSELVDGYGLGQPQAPVQPAPYFTDDDLRLTALEEEEESEDSLSFDREEIDLSERFGLSFFGSSSSSFSAVDTASVPPDYVLGPGDQLDVLFIGSESSRLSLEVDRAGEIVLPQLGRLAIAGLTFDVAAELINRRVREQRIGVEASVSMGRLRAINVLIAGEVRVPGARTLAAFSKLSQALYAAGGLSEIGALRSLTVNRAGQTVATFDAYDLLLRGDASNDISLRDGDVVFVPPVGEVVAIEGHVRRPSVYELGDGATAAELIEMAGGTLPGVAGRVASLERIARDGTPSILPLPLDDVELAKLELRDGDRLRVPTGGTRFSNRLVLRGAVQRPGLYGWIDGMRVSDLVQDPNLDLLPGADFEYALIISTDAANGRIRVRQFSLSEVLGQPNSAADPLLASHDEVIVFRNVLAEEPASNLHEHTELEPKLETEEFDVPASGLGAARTAGESHAAFAYPPLEEHEDKEIVETRQQLLEPIVARLEAQASPSEPVRTVSVRGAVYAPGRYPLGEGYTVADLLAAAGGLRDDAFAPRLELQRTEVTPLGQVVVTRVELDGTNLETLASTTLRSRDEVFAQAIPDWRPTRRVAISGEVRFPGEYLIGPRETLGQVIARAGGPTEQAFLDGAVFRRLSIVRQEQGETERLISELRRSALATSLTNENRATDLQALDLLVESFREAPLAGRMVVDLSRVVAGDRSADIVLQDGDSLVLPPLATTVTVVGEALRPGSFRFIDGLAADDYLALGAGLTRRADERRIYIVHANGEITRTEGRRWLAFGLTDDGVRPGDTIVVPINSSYRDTLDFWASVSQIAYQTGVAVAAILRI